MQEVTLDHIAIGARRIADAPDFLAGVLGGESVSGGPVGAYKLWTWRYPDGGELEVLEPDGPPGGFLHRFLDRNGPGLHHITFHLADLDEMVRRAEAMGHRMMGGREQPNGYREAFLHPKTAMGVVVQLVYVPEEHDPNRRPPPPRPHRMPPPASPPAVAGAVRVLGLRMRASDREKALRQWCELLGGRLVTDAADELIFRWQEPGMRVRVLIDPGAEDRSEAIEVQGPAPHVPDGVHPALGVRFDVVDASE